MKLFEVFSQNNEEKKSKLDFDLDDDLMFFMNNDPVFYRKKYFPFLEKFKEYYDQGKHVSSKGFERIVKNAYEEYKVKFPVEGLEDELTDEELNTICEKLHTEEIENIRKEQEKRESFTEDAAGVGIITKQNSTKDVGPGTLRKNLKAFNLTDSLEETYHGDEFFEAYGVMWFNEDDQLDEAEYQGRKVSLGKPMKGDVKKFKVYVKNPAGRIVKVNFGDPNMKIKKHIPNRRKSFRARHNCANPGPRTKARYWSCRKW